MGKKVSLTCCQFISLRKKTLRVHTFFLHSPKVSMRFTPSNVAPFKQVSVHGGYIW